MEDSETKPENPKLGNPIEGRGSGPKPTHEQIDLKDMGAFG